MNKITSLITGIILLAIPVSAAAATTLHIKQDVTIAHSNIWSSRHWDHPFSEDFGSIDISYAGHTNWAHVYMVGSGTTDVPLDDFLTYPVEYSVAVGTDPQGIFVPTLGAGCKGIAQKDETRTCTLDWFDLGPNATSAQPAQTPSVNTPTPAPVQTNVNIPLSNPTQAALSSMSTSTSNSATSSSVATQIQKLQEQVALLLKILLALLQAKAAAGH